MTVPLKQSFSFTLLSSFFLAKFNSWKKLVLLDTILYITFFFIIIDIADFFINDRIFTSYLKTARMQIREGGNLAIHFLRAITQRNI